MKELATAVLQRSDARSEQMDRLVECALPLTPILVEENLLAATAAPGPLLAVLTRRYYKIRSLETVRVEQVRATEVCRAEYVHDGRTVHVVAVRAREEDVAEALEITAEVARSVTAPDTVTADVYLPLSAATAVTPTRWPRGSATGSTPPSCRARSGAWR